MSCCSVWHCRARRSKNLPQLTLHKFPRRESKRKRWLDVIGINNLNPKHKDWLICSLHFDRKCYRTHEVDQLHDDAVPSILNVIPCNTDTSIKDENVCQDYQATDAESKYSDYYFDRHSQNDLTRPRLELIEADDEFDNGGIEEAPGEEYEAIGLNVACKLQRMTVQQRYHAELLVNKVLINGLKNYLSDETDLVGLSQFVDNNEDYFEN